MKLDPMRNILSMMKSTKMYFLITMVNASADSEEAYVSASTNDISATNDISVENDMSAENYVTNLYEINLESASRNKTFVEELLSHEYEVQEEVANIASELALKHRMTRKEKEICQEKEFDNNLTAADALIRILFTTTFFQPTNTNSQGSTLEDIPLIVLESLSNTFSSTLKYKDDDMHHPINLSLFQTLLNKILTDFEDFIEDGEWVDELRGNLITCSNLVTNNSLKIWKCLLHGYDKDDQFKKQLLAKLFDYKGSHELVYSKIEELLESEAYLQQARNITLSKEETDPNKIIARLNQTYIDEFIPLLVDLYFNIYEIYEKMDAETKEKRKNELTTLIASLSLFEKLSGCIMCSPLLAPPKKGAFLNVDIFFITTKTILEELKKDGNDLEKKQVCKIDFESILERIRNNFFTESAKYKKILETQKGSDSKLELITKLQRCIVVFMVSSTYTATENQKEIEQQCQFISDICEILSQDKDLEVIFFINQYLEAKKTKDISIRKTFEILKRRTRKEAPSMFPLLSMIFVLATFDLMSFTAYMTMKKRTAREVNANQH